MCTGDNILTAISVSRECGLIPPSIENIYIPVLDEKNEERYISWQEVNDPENKLDPITIKPIDIRQDNNYKLAITGDIFRFLLTEVKNISVIQNILMNCDIFARMSPDEKHELVEQLQKIDYTVGFCGDGANDCGALKAADVGISLSEAEASVAAPFTSRVFEISCVLDVIREGRSSLVTSFSCFKYMSLYSAIQFVTVTILYKTGTNLGDFQFYILICFDFTVSYIHVMVKTIRKDCFETTHCKFGISKNPHTISLSYYGDIDIPSIVMVLGKKRTMVYQAYSGI